MLRFAAGALSGQTLLDIAEGIDQGHARDDPFVDPVGQAQR